MSFEMNVIFLFIIYASFFLLCCSFDKPEEVLLCGDHIYDNKTEFCYDDKVYAMNICKGIPYEPYLQYCVDDKIIDKEIFTDLRDGKEYKTVVIDDQTWLAENLNYETAESKCYNNKPSYCEKYGRLYNWEDAKGVCPSGWHLPELKEWQKLSDWTNEEAGKKIKSTSGWRCIGEYGVLSDYSGKWYDEWDDLISTWSYIGRCARSGDGSDEFGFSALPGGVISHKGSSGYAGEYGFWWSSTNKDSTANYSSLVYYSGYLGGWEANKLHSLSVRCVKD